MITTYHIKDMTNIVRVPLTGKHAEKSISVSEEDLARVIKYPWKLYAGYPYNDAIGSLHHFILGPRPEHIPLDYVIDHKDRNSLNADKPNLRWVSPSFNAFNRPLLKGSSSRFKGVYWSSKNKKWAAAFTGKHIGYFVEERAAALAYARAAIKEFPLWAVDSDLLIGPNLLTSEEIELIVFELGLSHITASASRSLPTGVRISLKKFSAHYGRTYLGVYHTAEEASQIYNAHLQKMKDAAWAEYLLTPVLKDANNDAVIPLNGKKGEGLFAKVPQQFWHRLTFKLTWYYDGQYAAGSFDGVKGQLHRFVYNLLVPDCKEAGSVDHIDPSQKLNNLESNLRKASNSVQAYNKNKKEGCSSRYIGVYLTKANKWTGSVRHDGKRYHTKHFALENEAAAALNILAIQIKADDARILKIV